MKTAPLILALLLAGRSLAEKSHVDIFVYSALPSLLEIKYTRTNDNNFEGELKFDPIDPAEITRANFDMQQHNMRKGFLFHVIHRTQNKDNSKQYFFFYLTTELDCTNFINGNQNQFNNYGLSTVFEAEQLFKGETDIFVGDAKEIEFLSYGHYLEKMPTLYTTETVTNAALNTDPNIEVTFSSIGLSFEGHIFKSNQDSEKFLSLEELIPLQSSGNKAKFNNFARVADVFAKWIEAFRGYPDKNALKEKLPEIDPQNVLGFQNDEQIQPQVSNVDMDQQMEIGSDDESRMLRQVKSTLRHSSRVVI